MYPVVVRCHGGRADVGVFADRGVAEVGQVRHLGARAEFGVLGLHERADLAARPSTVPGRRYAYGPTETSGPTFAPTPWVADDTGALGDVHVGQGRVGADQRALADLGGATELGVGLDHRVAFQRDGDVDPGRGRIDQADPGAHPALVDPIAQQRPQLSELDPVVGAQRLVGIGGPMGGDRVPGRHEQPENVGEVLLALVVVGGQLGQRIAQQGGVERVRTGVDLPDRALRRARGAAPRRCARSQVGDDPSQPARIGDLGREQRRRRSLGLVPLDERGQGLRPYQRKVAVEHDDGAADLGRQTDPDRVPGAVLLGLQDRLGAGRGVGRGHSAPE